jgi:hypothetical protein
VLLSQITAALLTGHITYGLEEIVGEVRVTTRTIPEAFAVWLMFSPMFLGLIIGGVAPRWYVEKPWLWKALMCTGGAGYCLSSLLG